jgi:hypothetical protein
MRVNFRNHRRSLFDAVSESKGELWAFISHHQAYHIGQSRTWVKRDWMRRVGMRGGILLIVQYVPESIVNLFLLNL